MMRNFSLSRGTRGKLLCHASLLREMIADLKGCLSSNRACTMCDMYCIVHIINQCPFYQIGRVEKYEEIYRRCPNA